MLRMAGVFVIFAFLTFSWLILFGWLSNYAAEQIQILTGNPVLSFSPEEVLTRADEIIAFSPVIDSVYASFAVIIGVLFLWGVVSVFLYACVIRLLAGKKAKTVYRAVWFGACCVMLATCLFVLSFLTGKHWFPAIVFVMLCIFLLTFLPVYMIGLSCRAGVHKVSWHIVRFFPSALLVLACFSAIFLAGSMFLPVLAVQTAWALCLVSWIVWCNKIVVEGACAGK